MKQRSKRQGAVLMTVLVLMIVIAVVATWTV